jgi:hypothetical protein
MGGADDPGLGIREEHGRAVGGDDAEGDAGHRRHHRIGARTGTSDPGC